jgi:hypothetical protein
MDTERKLLGQAKVGFPLIRTFNALIETVDAEDWPDFRREPVGYYFKTALGHWVPSMIDHSLTDEQLNALQDADIQLPALLLLRDLFRHQHTLLRSSEPDAAWVEPLFTKVAERLFLPSGCLQDDGKPYDLENIDSTWAKPIAAPLGIMPEKLFMVHEACVTGCEEGSRKKPWWKFW